MNRVQDAAGDGRSLAPWPAYVLPGAGLLAWVASVGRTPSILSVAGLVTILTMPFVAKIRRRHTGEVRRRPWMGRVVVLDSATAILLLALMAPFVWIGDRRWMVGAAACAAVIFGPVYDVAVLWVGRDLDAVRGRSKTSAEGTPEL